VCAGAPGATARSSRLGISDPVALGSQQVSLSGYLRFLLRKTYSKFSDHRGFREGPLAHEPNTPPPKCEGDMEEQHQRCCCAHGRSCRVRRACRGLRTSLRQPRDGGSVATKSHSERWRSCKLSRGAAEPDCRGVCAARASDGGERRAAVCRQPLGYRDYKLQRMVCYCQAGV